jgi:ATP-dependent DNA helicase DinG
MALDVADFLFTKSQNIMFVEAPVGTGKSLGLLVPTSLYLKQKKKKSVYATATINLQNQIFTKDSETLQKLKLLSSREKILAQGQSHYVCSTAFYNNEDKFSEKEYDQLQLFFETCKYGLFAELYEMYPNFDKTKEQYLVLNQIPQFSCMYPCPGHSHRSEYKSLKKSLIITNHDQLIQSYLNSRENGSPIIYYENRVIIVDEAHSLKETFLGRLESRTKFNFREIPRPNSNLIDKNYKDEYAVHWNKVNELNNKFFDSNSSGANSRISLENSDIEHLKKIYQILNESSVAQILSEEVNRYSNRGKTDKLATVIETLDNYLKPVDKKWIERDGGLSFHRVTLSFEQEFSTMIDVLSRNSKIIFMSGTLTTGDPKQDIAENWKLSDDKYIYKNYPSIFDLKNQAIVYIPQDIV